MVADRTAGLSGGGARVLAVAGTAPGAGTSTVVMALGALCAWAGRRVVVLGDGGLLRLAGHDRWIGPGAAELARLAPADVARELPHVARPVRGLAPLWLLWHAGPPPSVDGWPADVVLVDLGVADDGRRADLYVSRGDASLASLAGAGSPFVLSGLESVAAPRATQLVGAPPLARLPWSARVARAGRAGRVPLALPGVYLHRLRPLARTLARTVAQTVTRTVAA